MQRRAIDPGGRLFHPYPTRNGVQPLRSDVCIHSTIQTWFRSSINRASTRGIRPHSVRQSPASIQRRKEDHNRRAFFSLPGVRASGKGGLDTEAKGLSTNEMHFVRLCIQGDDVIGFHGLIKSAVQTVSKLRNRLETV
jgi:hypothetical protein